MKLLLSFLLIVFVSCSKSGNAEKDNELPVIQILSPVDGTSFTAGSAVNINGTITDNKRLVEIHVHILNVVTGQLLIDIHRTPDGSTFSLNESFQVAAATQYRLQVIAKDNSNNENRSTIFISGN